METKLIEIMIVSLKTRKEAASNYIMNGAMGVEENLLTAQIEALENYKKKIQKSHKIFMGLLKNFEECAVDHANSGGGHPDDIGPKKDAYEETKQDLIDYVEGL